MKYLIRTRMPRNSDTKGIPADGRILYYDEALKLFPSYVKNVEEILGRHSYQRAQYKVVERECVKVNFSKNGNFVYQAYVQYKDDMWCLQMADCDFVAEMPTRQGLIEEASNILEWYIRRNIEHDNGVFLPQTKLKPEKGSEILEFELDKEISDMVMDFVYEGGEVFNYAKPVKRNIIPPLTVSLIIEVLKYGGWHEVKSNHRSHAVFKHRDMPWKIIVPKHNKKTLSDKTQKSIIIQSCVDEEIWLTWLSMSYSKGIWGRIAAVLNRFVRRHV